MYCVNKDCPDFKATGLHGEYRDGIAECPYCGEALAHAIPETPPDGRQDLPDDRPTDSWAGEGPQASGQTSDDLEPVYETSDPSEVPVVRSFLDAHGIPHVVSGAERFDAFRGSLSPMRFNPRAGTTVFMVPAGIAEDVRELLAELEEEENR